MWEIIVFFVIFDTCDVVYNWPISLLPLIVLDNLTGHPGLTRAECVMFNCILVFNSTIFSFHTFLFKTRFVYFFNIRNWGKNCKFQFLRNIKDLVKEIRIYIRVEFTWKKCKTAILYCFHTAGVLHIFALYNLLGPGTSFHRKSKIYNSFIKFI